MGLEALKSAERAAGFAMAPADDLCLESERTAVPQAMPWRPSEPVIATPAVAVDAKATQPSISEWLKGLFGLSSGRRATA